ncbi:MAG: Ku protein [Hyphomonadaceae bacterium]
MAARPTWQGHLKLSLVTCPVALYNAVSPKSEIRFNLINPDTGNRIRMLTVDAGTEDPVERKSLVKGFEVTKGEYVTVTQEEIDSVRLESTKTIEIESFVPADEIDRLYWDNPFYLAPDGKMAAEPFAVIRAAMERSGQVALGRVVMAQRERLLALEPRENGIIATTLRTRDEVRDMAQFFDDIPAVKADADMIHIAERIIAQKSADFDPSKFDDRYEDALRDLIAKKQKGQKISRPEAPKAANVIDLMDALKQSLKGSPTPRRRAAAAAKPASPRRAAAHKSAPHKRAKK